MIELLRDGPPDAAATVLLAHGAGAPMDSPFMATIAVGLANAGTHVVRFEFPYMAKRRDGGRSGAPDREPVLRATFAAAVDAVRAQIPASSQLVIGGKSMGGRIASLCVDELAEAGKVQGLVCLGYPFRPPGAPAVPKTPDRRLAHLASLRTPTLIVQGERDSFGGRDAVATYRLSAAVELAWIPDGDHSFAPRKASGLNIAQNLALAVEELQRFVASLAAAASQGTKR